MRSAPRVKLRPLASVARTNRRLFSPHIFAGLYPLLQVFIVAQ